MGVRINDGLTGAQRFMQRHPNYHRDRQRAAYAADPVKCIATTARSRRRLSKYPHKWARMALASIASRCKKTGREFSLTLSDLVTPEFCPVFGTHLLYGCSRHDPNGPSLDRIDNTKGYVPGNVVVVSLRANLLKRDATLDELEKLVRFLKRTRRSGAAHTKAELDAARKFVEKREADRLLEIKAEDRRRIDHPLRKAMQAKHGSALCPYCHKTVQLIKRGVFGMHTKPGPLTGSAVRCEGFHRKPVATQKCGCPGLAHYLSCPKMAEKAKADRKRKRSKA